MESTTYSGPVTEMTRVSRGWRWASWAITALVAAFLLLDAAMKFFPTKSVAAGFASLGWPLRLSPVLGWIVLVCTVLYLIPRTAVLGAILLTGYLGGAVATNLRLEYPVFTVTLSAVYFGVVMWGALWLRDPAIRALIPLRRGR